MSFKHKYLIPAIIVAVLVASWVLESSFGFTVAPKIGVTS